MSRLVNGSAAKLRQSGSTNTRICNIRSCTSFMLDSFCSTVDGNGNEEPHLLIACNLTGDIFGVWLRSIDVHDALVGCDMAVWTTNPKFTVQVAKLSHTWIVTTSE